MPIDILESCYTRCTNMRLLFARVA